MKYLGVWHKCINAEGCGTHMWCSGRLLPISRTSRRGSSHWGHLHVQMSQRHSQPTRVPRPNPLCTFCIACHCIACYSLTRSHARRLHTRIPQALGDADCLLSCTYHDASDARRAEQCQCARYKVSPDSATCQVLRSMAQAELIATGHAMKGAGDLLACSPQVV